MRLADITIRAAVPDDEPDRLFRLLWQLNPADPRPAVDRLHAIWRDLHAQAGRRVLLAIAADDELAGTLDTLIVPNLTRQARPFMLVENVVVDPRWRRRGVGTRLLDAALELARAGGCYKVQLLTNTKRTEAHKFYAAAGFTSSALGFRRYL